MWSKPCFKSHYFEPEQPSKLSVTYETLVPVYVLSVIWCLALVVLLVMGFALNFKEDALPNLDLLVERISNSH
jgi:hypothetical protein